MKKFLLKLTVFGVSLLLLALPPLYLLKLSGENFTSLDVVIKSDKKSLIGYAYNEKNYRYLKWKKIAVSHKFDILALGSSRVLQFRQNMFTTRFYNAGYTISSIADFVPFLESLPKEKLPNYLIIGLDQFMFNKKWDSITTYKSSTFWTKAFHLYPKPKTVIEVWKDIFDAKYSFTIPNYKNNTQLVGLNACIYQTGFRNDGSMYYRKDIQKRLSNDSTARDYNFEETFSRIKYQNLQFKYGNEVNPKAIEELEKLLNYCQKNSIYVVAILPPFANAVNQKMNALRKYNYIKQIYPNCISLFKNYGFELYDYTNPKAFNGNDIEMIDGFHGGEMSYLKLLISIVKTNSRLSKTTSLTKLKYDLEKAINRYEVYPN